MYLDERDNRTEGMQDLRLPGRRQRTELLHRSFNECFCKITQLQDESLSCSASRCIRSTILHVQAMQAFRIVSHGTLGEPNIAKICLTV